MAFWPYKYGTETWQGKPEHHRQIDTIKADTHLADEYSKTLREKNNQAGLLTLISALISFLMRVISDALTVAADWAKPKYEESKKKTDEYVREGQSKLTEAREFAGDRLGQAKQAGQEYLGMAQEKGQQVQDGVKDGAQETKKQAEETKDKAEKKAK